MDENKDVLRFESIEVLKANESKYIKPFRIHYTLNGNKLIWDCMKIHDSVSVLIFNKTTKKLVFVRQFRPAIFFAYLCNNIDTLQSNDFSADAINNVNQLLATNKSMGYTLELCAGIIDKDGKTPVEIAAEEVEEETGYKVHANSLKFISSFRNGVGVSGTLQHLFYSQITNDTPKGKGGGIGDERIDVIELSIEETKKLMFCEDSEAMLSRPSGLLFALSWFLYQHLPTL